MVDAASETRLSNLPPNLFRVAYTSYQTVTFTRSIRRLNLLFLGFDFTESSTVTVSLCVITSSHPTFVP